MLRQCVLLIFILTACNLSYGTPPPPPTPDVPFVEFQTPTNNQTLVQGNEVVVSLVAQDHGVGVSRVELLIDDLMHNEAFPEVSAAVPVFSVNMNWLADGIGYHSLTAIPYRADGTAGRAQTISVLVVPNDT